MDEWMDGCKWMGMYAWMNGEIDGCVDMMPTVIMATSYKYLKDFLLLHKMGCILGQQTFDLGKLVLRKHMHAKVHIHKYI